VSEIIYQGIACSKTGGKNVSAVLNVNQKIWVSWHNMIGSNPGTYKIIQRNLWIVPRLRWLV